MERLPVELAPLRAVIVDRALEMPGTVAQIRSRGRDGGGERAPRTCFACFEAERRCPRRRLSAATRGNLHAPPAQTSAARQCAEANAAHPLARSRTNAVCAHEREFLDACTLAHACAHNPRRLMNATSNSRQGAIRLRRHGPPSGSHVGRMNASTSFNARRMNLTASFKTLRWPPLYDASAASTRARGNAQPATSLRRRDLQRLRGNRLGSLQVRSQTVLRACARRRSRAGGSGWDARKATTEFLQTVSVAIAKGSS
jgi:hypothetical protein